MYNLIPGKARKPREKNCRAANYDFGFHRERKGGKTGTGETPGRI